MQCLNHGFIGFKVVGIKSLDHFTIVTIDLGILCNAGNRISAHVIHLESGDDGFLPNLVSIAPDVFDHLCLRYNVGGLIFTSIDQFTQVLISSLSAPFLVGIPFFCGQVMFESPVKSYERAISLMIGSSLYSLTYPGKIKFSRIRSARPLVFSLPHTSRTGMFV